VESSKTPRPSPASYGFANNSENLDEIIDNLRRITENMNAFTETIRARPYTLIRSSEPKDHQPGQAPPQ